MGKDFEIFLSQLADDEVVVREVFVGEEDDRPCVCYSDLDSEFCIKDHQKNKNEGGIELERKIFKALLGEKIADDLLKEDEEQDLKDKNKAELKLVNLNENEN